MITDLIQRKRAVILHISTRPRLMYGLLAVPYALIMATAIYFAGWHTGPHL